jgi:predicted transcriptional regulator
MGFSAVAQVDRRYRSGQCEYAFVGDAREVVARTGELVRPTLFGAEVGATVSGQQWMIMSIHPKYAELILSGRKTIEIRRKFSAGHVGNQMLIYSTHPTKALVGVARVAGASRVRGDGSDEAVCSAACVGPEELQKYATGVKDVWAIQLADVIRLERPLELGDLSRMLKTKMRPPVSFEIIRRGSSWGRIADQLALNLNAPVASF